MTAAIIVLSLFFFLGAYLLISNLSKLSFSKKVAKWPKVAGIVKEVYDKKEWHTIENADLKANPVQLRYYYSFQGKEYHNSILGIDYSNWVGSQNKSHTVAIKDMAGLMQHIKDNPQVTIWVNPQYPKETFLLLQQKSSVFLSCVGACLIIWAIGISIIVSETKVLKLADQIIVKEYKTDEEFEEMEEREWQELNPDSTASDSDRVDSILLH